MDSITRKDIERLRALAARQREIAESDAMKRVYADWQRHGRFEKSARPMVTIEFWTFADEIIPGLLQCETKRGRDLETRLLANIIPHEMFGDDTPVRNYIPVDMRTFFNPFGLRIIVETAGNSDYVGAGQKYHIYIEDLEEDWHLLGKSTYGVDMEATQREIDGINELIGDILPARRGGEALKTRVAQDLVQIMSMENLYTAMMEVPELVHRAVDRLVDDYIEYLKYIESFGLLPTVYDEHLPEGSYCFTDELPSSGTALKTTQVWGYMDAEEMESVSPGMYKEFFSDHYRRIAEQFGALSYGCCEAIHRFWEDSVERLPNLKKVSISAWCDVDYMGERLRDSNIVFVRKPTANLLGVQRELDEPAVKEYFRKTATAARGCRMEITQRDVYLLHGNIEKVRRYVELIRDAVDRYWRP